MAFPREIQLLFCDLRHAYFRPLTICKCITRVTSERFPKAYEIFRSGINKMATTSVVLTIGRFNSPRKALELFPGAYTVTDRRFNVCFIGFNRHFG